MITFATEDWFDAYPEMQPLWAGHWQEVATHQGHIKLDVDLEAYADMAKQGMLHLTVARSAGRIVGYYLLIVKPHLHYKSTLHAFTDIYYIHPDHRRGPVGIRLFRETEKALKARGVKRVIGPTKDSLNMGRLFEFLGWKIQEHVYTKYLGED